MLDAGCSPRQAHLRLGKQRAGPARVPSSCRGVPAPRPGGRRAGSSRVSGLVDGLLGVPGWVVLVVVGLVVFAEDALFVGFVLPGETLAVLGSVSAKLGHVPLWAVLVTVTAAAIIGDSVGYEVGRL